jgi:PAS domain S-box-containing protein
MEFDLGRVLDALPAMVWTALPDGQIDFINRRWSEYTGLGLDKAHGWDWQAAVDPHDLPGLLERWRSILASGEPAEMEARVRRFDGQYRWYLVHCSPMRDDAGRIHKWYGINTDIDDLKRAEETSRESERYSRLIVDSIPGMVATFTPGGEVEFVNNQILEYFGRTPEEQKRWQIGDAIHPEDLPRTVEVFTQAIASGTPFELEVRARRFDGVYRWFQSRNLPLRDTNGRVVRWYNLLIDIDEMKRAEEALRASEAQLAEAERDLRLTIDTIPVFVATYQPDGTRSSVNHTWRDYVGLTLEEATGAGAMTFPYFHPDDVERNDKAWRASLASGEPLSIEVRTRRADGQYRWHIMRRVPFRDEKGNIVRWYSVGVDIDDQKRAEEALKRSEAFLAEGQHLARMGNFSWKVATGEIIWSEQINRIFEFKLGAPVTLDLIVSRVHPEDLPLMADMVGRAQRGESDFEYQQRIVMPDDSIKHLHLIAHRTGDHPGQIEYIGAVLDITQRRLAEEALSKARSQLAHVSRVTSLGALTASIAHEVNQPLSGIITNASTCMRMLATDPPNVEGARETARRTIRDGNRAADVITRLRALFSRKAIKIEPVDLNEAAREVIALSSGDLQRSRVVLRTELADGLALAGGDRVQLQQVIINLLRNAADAMSGVDDRPRRLVISTEPDKDGRVRLSVQDAGVGFGSQSTERLFEAFYTTKGDGMGIGLSVSRSIIESHNGRLWAEPNVGPGATFSFSIPEYSGDEAPAQDIGAARVPVASSAQSAGEIS